MKVLADYIMRGRPQAIIVASTLALLSLKFPPISVLSSASVALVTLRLGATQGLIVMLGAALAASLLGYFAIDSYQFAFFYALLLWLPIWVISIVLREGRRMALAVETAVMIGILGVAGFYLYEQNPAGLWEGLLQQIAEQATQQQAGASPDAPISQLKEQIKEWSVSVSPYMTGMFAAGTVFGLLFGLFLGRWWQSLLFNPGGFKQEFLALNVGRKLSAGSLVILAAAFFGTGTVSEIAWNMVILLFALFAVIGTSVMHVVFAHTKMSRFAVPLFYVTLVLVPQALPPVAVVGLIDAWLDIRSKYSNQSSA